MSFPFPSLRRPALSVLGLHVWVAVVMAAPTPAWTASNAEGIFVAAKDRIIATSSPRQDEARLVAQDTAQDFILEFEFRQDAGAPAAAVEFRGQYRCSLSGLNYSGPGALSEPAGRGWLYPLMAPSAAQPGAWNRFRLEAIGSSIRTWVNGRPVAHLIDVPATGGRLALWLAPDGRSAGKSEWRGVQLQTTALQAAAADTVFVRSFLLNQLSDAERAQGWRLLWDGSSPAGWRGARLPAFPADGWKMAQGELTVPETGGGESKKGGDIVTEAEYSAFELQLDFLLSPGANSGIKYFVDEGIPTIGGSAIGLEFQLLDDERHPDAKLGVDGNRTLGSLYDLIPRQPLPDAAGLRAQIGTWQHARLVVYPDQRVEHWLNGVKVVAYERGSTDFLARVAASKYQHIAGFGLAPQGHLLLQDHGNEVHFRNLKLRPLSRTESSPTTPSP